MTRGLNLGRTRARLLVAIAVIAATSALSLGTALADTTTPPPADIPPTDTDFTQTIGVAQFDPALGTLNSITVELDATVTGSMGVENTSTTSTSDGNLELSALVSVALAIDPTTMITVASPATTQTFSFPVYDGVFDFGGTSGATYADINDVQMVTETLTDPAFLAAATGTGTFDFIVDAVGTSGGTASSGNTSFFFLTQAGATITVTYDYQPASPAAIDIEKATNGDDADLPVDAVRLDPGDDVTWTYVVTNTGGVDLTNVVVTDDQGVAVSCPQDTLTVGETMTCTATGTAGGVVNGPQFDYANVGTVTGVAPDESTVTDSDPSHYVTNVGVKQLPPAIEIVKTPDDQAFSEDQTPVTVTWTITVTNPDTPTAVDLFNVTVTDAMAPNCDRVIGDLAVGASFTYTCSLGGVTAGLTNVAIVTGDDGAGTSVTDNDDAVVRITPPELIGTGSESQNLAIFGALLMALGVALVVPKRRRRNN